MSNQPKNLFDLFWTFTCVGVQSFGGAMAIVQRTLIDKKRWYSKDEYVELLTLAQTLPGPNATLASLLVGDRFFGLKGALVGFFGLIWIPLIVLTLMIVLYQSASDVPWVQGALRGVAAVVSGMILGSALSLCSTAKKSALGLPIWGLFLLVTFLVVGILRVPMVWALPALAVPAVYCAFIFLKRRRRQQTQPEVDQ